MNTKTIDIRVSEDIRKACPDFVGAAIFANVRNQHFSQNLWNEIEQVSLACRQRHTVDSIKELSSIAATREAYRRCGKDPSRYRPSGEALCRRILRGLPLYQINVLVDLINAVSIRYGYSIGGFDLDKIEGNQLELGIGKQDEPYEGIGRGAINIEGMPVYRDALGGVGTPTSDNERTKISDGTCHLLMIVNGYDGPDGLPDAINYANCLLCKYAAAEQVQNVYFQ